MKKISLLPMIAVVGCLGWATGVKAQSQTGTSSHSGSVSPNCSVTATPGTLVGNSNPINGSNFPTELTSTASPGKFTTLCNTASSQISVELTSFTKSSPSNQGGGPYDLTYNLSANSPSAYVGNTILGTNIPESPARTGTIAHGFSSTPSELIVSGKIKAAAGKILGNGTYKIEIQATLTPQ